MKAKLLVFVAVGAVLIGVLVWLAPRSSTSSHPIAAGPERSAESTGSAVAHLDKATTEMAVDAIAVSPRVESQPAQPVTREALRAETIVLYGFVRMAEDLPAPTEPAGVAVVDDKGEQVHAEASAEGAYSISGLHPGKYHLTASAQPNAKAEANLDLELTETPKRYDITLTAKVSLLVKVVDRAGKPVTKSWLGAVATRMPPGEWVDGTPNADLFDVGRFLDKGLEGSTRPEGCLGRLDLEIAPPVFVSLLHNQRVIATQRAEAGQREVVFVVDADSPLLKTGKVRVRFVDQAGQDVPKLWATLNGGSSTRPARPDASGLVWNGLEPGWYFVQVYATGLEQPKLECRVEPGEEKDLGTVTLQSEQWISGTIIEPHKTSERIVLSCDPYDPDPNAADSFERYKSWLDYGTEADRTFRIGGRSRGLYLLKYNGHESGYGIWARVVDTRAGPVENVQVVLVPGVPLIVHAANGDWTSIFFRVLDKNDTPLESTRLWSSSPQSLKLAPGEYDVEVRSGSSEPVRKQVTIGSEPVELALP